MIFNETIEHQVGPLVIKDKPIVFFDVDDTLVLWNQDITEENQHLAVPGIEERVLVHVAHVESLKQFHARGHTVVVWSQGGSAWALKVVVALGIEPYVDMVMPKPYWFFDDLPASAWLDESKRTWKNPEYLGPKTIKPTERV